MELTKAQQAIIKKTAAMIQKRFAAEPSGHDWWHIYRVWKSAAYLAKKENASPFIVELAALLHDIADWKFHGGNEQLGPQLAREWLEKLQVKNETVNAVSGIIENLSFKGLGVKNKIKTLEGKIVQDADRLDAIGAIGIARTFAYGGYKGREIYNPSIPPVKHRTFLQYKRSQGPTINHFYEKLLHLKSLMNTATAKKIAENRHQILEKFLKDFFREWECRLS